MHLGHRLIKVIFSPDVVYLDVIVPKYLLYHKKSAAAGREDGKLGVLYCTFPVSYTHLTLPTIYSV